LGAIAPRSILAGVFTPTRSSVWGAAVSSRTFDPELHDADVACQSLGTRSPPMDVLPPTCARVRLGVRETHGTPDMADEVIRRVRARASLADVSSRPPTSSARIWVRDCAYVFGRPRSASPAEETVRCGRLPWRAAPKSPRISSPCCRQKPATCGMSVRPLVVGSSAGRAGGRIGGRARPWGEGDLRRSPPRPQKKAVRSPSSSRCPENSAAWIAGGASSLSPWNDRIEPLAEAVARAGAIRAISGAPPLRRQGQERLTPWWVRAALGSLHPLQTIAVRSTGRRLKGCLGGVEACPARAGGERWRTIPVCGRFTSRPRPSRCITPARCSLQLFRGGRAVAQRLLRTPAVGREAVAALLPLWRGRSRT